MLNTTVTNFTEEVTSEASVSFAESPKLTLEQGQALFLLIKAFRPDWTDNWKAVMRKLQDASDQHVAHGIVSHVITAAATKPDLEFEHLEFAGVDLLPNQNN